MAPSILPKSIPPSDRSPSSQFQTKCGEVSGKLLNLKDRLKTGPLSPHEIQQGLEVLGEAGSVTLEQTIQNGLSLEALHGHAHETLTIIREQVVTLACKLDASTRMSGQIDQDVCEGFKTLKSEIRELRQEMVEVKQLMTLVADHLGIR